MLLFESYFRVAGDTPESSSRDASLETWDLMQSRLSFAQKSYSPSTSEELPVITQREKVFQS
jgi:hypothetical protein